MGRMQKIFFNLEPGSWHGFQTETLNATLVREGVYKLENSPFFVSDVSFRDWVAASRVEGKLLFDKVIVRSGHSTYRILLKDAEQNQKRWYEYWLKLQSVGCTYEENRSLNLPMLTVDVPAEVDIYSVYRLLQDGEEAGVWEFEEGHCGHPTRE